MIASPVDFEIQDDVISAVQPRPMLEPYRLISWWEMIVFWAGNFHDLLSGLQRCERALQPDSGLPWPPDMRKEIETILDSLMRQCRELNMQPAYSPIEFVSRRLRLTPNLQPLAGDVALAERLSTLRELIESELRVRRFLYLPREKVKYWLEGGFTNFGTAYDKFPVARSNIDSACHCFAVEEYTASAFHSMRVAEFGLRWMAKQLKVTISHKKKIVPIEYGDWEQVLTAAKGKIEEAHRLPKNAKREDELKFYSDVADHCGYMKDLWRNELAHARREYSEPESLAVLNRVCEFMKRLATRVK